MTADTGEAVALTEIAENDYNTYGLTRLWLIRREYKWY